MHDREFLNNYFHNHWCPSTSKYIYSGYAIADKIYDQEFVLDVGCGTHPFKKYINEIIGIDPAHDEADIKVSIEDFKTEHKFDVALCLGSINFGTEEIIAFQIEKLNSLLKHSARIYWRLNPGQHDHQSKLCEQIDFFPWTFDKLKEFADKYGFEQINCAIDTNGKHQRLYAEWHR